ncbi:unnamed protein product [Rotaria sordida]|uniref:Pex N-terminal domain-containing protein n=1 Tax=Rotaria sordida TaxID=392033 RepID=A0A815LMQ4_9BILA|nr:unnamed protein product [Rotaria sordida]CAF3607669.1 unnamed protein product [Rotaria sordida]
MTSSNIQSTLNFTSSTIISPPLPSVFELLAQERLTDLIRPCLRQIFKFLHEIRPLSNSLRILYKYKDEFILLIESIVQWLYLHFYSALIGEHFYGLKRTANHRLRSLIFSVFLPYVKLKLDSLHEQMSMNNNNNNNNNRHTTFYMILQILPKIQVFIEGICWLYRIGYAFGRIEYYSPELQLAGVKLTYAKDPSPVIPSSTNASRFFSIISQIISSGLFLVQFIEWWNSTNGSKKNSINANINPPLPTTVRTQSTIGKRQCPLCRQPCNVPTAVLGSGYVYCYTCISDYVKRYHRCPTTHQPINLGMLYPFLDNVNTSELYVITFLYSLIVFIIILPPSELASAGFSIQNIFSYFLVETEEISFIRYHIKRISIKYIIHSFLSLGYVFILLYYCDWSLGVINVFINLFTQTSIILRFILYICLLIPIITSLIVLQWHLNDCYMHPIVRQLRLFIQINNQQQEQTWHTVESSINTEFRRFDKFTCGTATSNVRCYVLDSWILKCSMYHVNIAQQSNVRVELVDAHDIHLQETNEEVSLSTQYLNIVIKSYDIRIKPFYIRLKANEYDDLRGKLQANIENVKNIVVRQSLSELFVTDFRRHVIQNPKYRLPPNQRDLDTCIGCLQTNANVKLVKNCDAANIGRCQTCFCRPMWCLECLGKWFASRQDQARPDTWLQSTCPCPSCRSVFCILDISLVEF